MALDQVWKIISEECLRGMEGFGETSLALQGDHSINRLDMAYSPSGYRKSDNVALYSTRLLVGSQTTQ
jgi:hypothetical protein